MRVLDRAGRRGDNARTVCALGFYVGAGYLVTADDPTLIMSSFLGDALAVALALVTWFLRG